MGTSWIRTSLPLRSTGCSQMILVSWTTAASDLVTPAAVLLAIGGGGTIVGVGHTQRKESKRLSTTEKLLSDFGLKAHVRAEGVIDIPAANPPRGLSGM